MKHFGNISQQGILLEKIVSGSSPKRTIGPQGVALQTFVSSELGATGFSTGTVTLSPGAELPHHTHPVSQAMVILEGIAAVSIEGRTYELTALDCLHVPRAVAHSVRNLSANRQMIAHWTLASAEWSHVFVDASYPLDNRGADIRVAGDPENIRRFASADVYELSEGALFRDLFSRRFGAVGICGGYGKFAPGASLPCHIHAFDESITIVQGSAMCMVQGSRYNLSAYDTAFVPTNRPHRFINDSDKPMAMVWVYAGDEPDRVLVDAGFCDGSMSWKRNKIKEVMA